MSIEKKNEYTYMDDDEWLEFIMSHYGEELTRVAYLYLKDWKLAEDAVQDTFIKCYLKRNEFRGESAQKTWIYTILTNTCKDVIRSSNFKKVVIINKTFKKFVPQIESTENLAIKRERELNLSQSVLSLPIRYREVIILYYYNGFSTKEISNMLRVNESTIRVRLNRARGKLKKILTRGGAINEG